MYLPSFGNSSLLALKKEQGARGVSWYKEGKEQNLGMKQRKHKKK